MRTLIIPDLHCNTDWVHPFVASVPHDHLVFLGDYFDREIEPGETLKTALWLKQTLNLYPHATFLLGNHDMHYRFPDNDHLKCQGFTWEKEAIINSYITQSDWSRFRLYEESQGFLLSHAGVSDVVFRPVGRTLDLKWIKEACDRALINASLNVPDDVIEPDALRGGKRREGGIIWLDWHLFTPLPGINQIVGHTVDDQVRTLNLEKGGVLVSQNYCIDCMCRYAGYIEDGQFFVLETPAEVRHPPEH